MDTVVSPSPGTLERLPQSFTTYLCTPGLYERDIEGQGITVQTTYELAEGAKNCCGALHALLQLPQIIMTSGAELSILAGTIAEEANAAQIAELKAVIDYYITNNEDRPGAMLLETLGALPEKSRAYYDQSSQSTGTHEYQAASLTRACNEFIAAHPILVEHLRRLQDTETFQQLTTDEDTLTTFLKEFLGIKKVSAAAVQSTLSGEELHRNALSVLVLWSLMQSTESAQNILSPLIGFYRGLMSYYYRNNLESEITKLHQQQPETAAHITDLQTVAKSVQAGHSTVSELVSLVMNLPPLLGNCLFNKVILQASEATGTSITRLSLPQEVTPNDLLVALSAQEISPHYFAASDAPVRLACSMANTYQITLRQEYKIPNYQTDVTALLTVFYDLVAQYSYGKPYNELTDEDLENLRFTQAVEEVLGLFELNSVTH